MRRPPVRDKVWSIAEARERFGHTDLPIERYAAYQEAHGQPQRGSGPV